MFPKGSDHPKGRGLFEVLTKHSWWTLLELLKQTNKKHHFSLSYVKSKKIYDLEIAHWPNFFFKTLKKVDKNIFETTHLIGVSKMIVSTFFKLKKEKIFGQFAISNSYLTFVFTHDREKCFFFSFLCSKSVHQPKFVSILKIPRIVETF